jgi:hypothetical protein
LVDYDTGPLHGVAHYMRKRARDLARHNRQRQSFESYAVVCDGAALHIAGLERQLKTHDEVIAMLRRQVEELSTGDSDLGR